MNTIPTQNLYSLQIQEVLDIPLSGSAPRAGVLARFRAFAGLCAGVNPGVEWEHASGTKRAGSGGVTARSGVFVGGSDENAFDRQTIRL